MFCVVADGREGRESPVAKGFGASAFIEVGGDLGVARVDGVEQPVARRAVGLDLKGVVQMHHAGDAAEIVELTADEGETRFDFVGAREFFGLS